MCRVSSTQTLQPSWLEPPSHTHSQTNTLTLAHTHKQIGCMRRWKGTATQQDVRWVFCFLCSLRLRRPLTPPVDMTFTNIPLQFSQSFYMPWRTLEGLTLASPPSLYVLYISDTHCRAFFGGSFEEMSCTKSHLPQNSGLLLTRLDGSSALASLASCSFYTLCCLLI